MQPLGSGRNGEALEEPAIESGVRLSVLLAGLIGAEAPERVTIDYLLIQLRDRAFGVLILLLALPNVLPGPAIPGFSAVFGLPLAVLALQMTIGYAEPRLPGVIKRRNFARDKLQRFLGRAAPIIARFERLLRPRYLVLLDPRLLGLTLIVLALVMSLPLPLGNLPAACGIIVVAMGMVAGDGAAVVVGLIIGVLAAAWNGFLLFAGMAAFDWLMRLFS